jgi:purine nucleosidase
MARPIIIDADPGQDDAVALLLALGSPDDFDLLGITAVAGNVPLTLTETNARKIVELSGRTDVGVYAGCSRPMVGELVTAEYVHGPTGLDGAELPDPVMPVAEAHAIDFIVDTVRDSSEPITLCALGPLTNVAMALVRAPDIVDRLSGLVMMGGGLFEGGNTTPAAEFNIYVDPHAAQVVFTSGIDITMMPLDVTHKALTTPARVEAFRGIGTSPGTAVAGLLDFYDRHDKEKYGIEGGPLHDPCVVAYLIDSSLFSGRRCHVEIVTEGPASGMTMIDWWGVTERDPNAMVMGDIDADRFFALLVERIGTLPAG